MAWLFDCAGIAFWRTPVCCVSLDPSLAFLDWVWRDWTVGCTRLFVFRSNFLLVLVAWWCSDCETDFCRKKKDVENVKSAQAKKQSRAVCHNMSILTKTPAFHQSMLKWPCLLRKSRARFWLKFKSVQTLFKKRSNAQGNSGTLWWFISMRSYNKIYSSSMLNRRLLLLFNYQVLTFLIGPMESCRGSKSQFSSFFLLKPALWRIISFFPFQQKYFQRVFIVALN